jgi:5-oxopent-3-ene-1,2,5-tricarboxylate decarboxylase/2-hydroxyhepta-2,4-diene-1,7-dioate isomerase
MACSLPTFDFAPYRLSGTVYATLLNHPPLLAALGDAVHQAPYKAPPTAPVLSVKPRNTLARDGETIRLPAGVDALAVGATLGIVIGRVACAVSEARALAVIAGYVIVNDLSVPHDSHYRPAVRFRAGDGFCPIGPVVRAAYEVADPDALDVTIEIDGRCVQRCSTAGRQRGVARLVADISDFMTLQPGDLLLLGPAADAPTVRAGQDLVITIDGLGSLHNQFAAAGEAA